MRGRGHQFGIAAKRLKSLQQLKKHVRKGAQQIAASKRPGILVLDLSYAWNRANEPITSQLVSQLYLMTFMARSHQFFDEHHSNIERWVRDTGVRAVLTLDYSFRVRPDGTWGHEGLSNWLQTTFDDAQAEREFKAFNRGFLKGFPVLIDYTTEENEPRLAANLA